MRVLGFIAVLIALFSFSAPVFAGDRFVDGSIGGETPFGQRPDRPQDLSPMVLGQLKLHNVLPHFNLFANGQYQLRTDFPYTKENKFAIGAEYEWKYGLVPYVYFQRWPSIGDNRLVCGIKWNFKSHKF